MVNLEHLMTDMYIFHYNAQHKAIEYQSTDATQEGGTTLSHQEAVILQYNLEQLMKITNQHIQNT